MRMSRSSVSSLGVVPELTSAWKPEIAPQAMVMNTNGNSLPAKIGPVPSTNCVSAGMCSTGFSQMMATASSTTVPSFRKVDR